MTLSSRSLYRRGMMETLEDRNLLTSVPWNEVTELLVPRGLTGAGEAGEIRNVAMDGDYVVVGVRNNDQVATDAGSAYVFRRDNNGTLNDLGDDKWPLVSTLYGAGTSPQGSDLQQGDWFGESIAIDGEWMFISADHRGPALGDGLGVCYVYHFANGFWQFSQKLVPIDRGGANDHFGIFNSVSIEGNLAAIGAQFDDNSMGVDQGAVYMFRFNGNEWVQTAKVIPTEPNPNSTTGGGLGIAVEVKYGELFVGSLRADTPAAADTGAVYVFAEDPDTGQWQQTDKLFASDGKFDDRFGYSFSRQGNAIVVGASAADANGTDSGAAYVFEKDPNTGGWSQTRLLSSDLEAGDRFGRHVEISNGVILISSQDGNGIIPNTGAVYAFEKVGEQWTEIDKMFQPDRTPAPSADETFGFHFDFGDGAEAVISGGMPGNNYDSGHVYVYAQDATRLTTAYRKTSSQALADRKGKKDGVTTSSINVSDNGTILDLDVRLDIAHTRDSDLSAVLKAPNGTQIPLFARVGGSGDNFTTTVFDHEASTPIGNGTAPFTGRFKPTGNLSSLYGTSLSGTWQLIVTDSVALTSGTLLGWSVRVKYQLPGANPQGPGDFDFDSVLGAADIDLLFAQLRLPQPDRAPRFDLTGDGAVDEADRDRLIRDILHTHYGDTNLDRRFDSTDLVLVFQAGEYEDTIGDNSTWADGDWDGDGDFTSSDLVLAFQNGGYNISR